MTLPSSPSNPFSPNVGVISSIWLNWVSTNLPMAVDGTNGGAYTLQAPLTFNASGGAGGVNIDDAFTFSNLTTGELKGWSSLSWGDQARALFNDGVAPTAFVIDGVVINVLAALGTAFINGDPIHFTTPTGGDTLPSPLVTGIVYYAVATSGDTFSVSLSPGGSAIALGGGFGGAPTVAGAASAIFRGFAGLALTGHAAFALDATATLKLSGAARLTLNTGTTATWGTGSTALFQSGSTLSVASGAIANVDIEAGGSLTIGAGVTASIDGALDVSGTVALHSASVTTATAGALLVGALQFGSAATACALLLGDGTLASGLEVSARSSIRWLAGGTALFDATTGAPGLTSNAPAVFNDALVLGPQTAGSRGGVIAHHLTNAVLGGADFAWDLGVRGDTIIASGATDNVTITMGGYSAGAIPPGTHAYVTYLGGGTTGKTVVLNTLATTISVAADTATPATAILVFDGTQWRFLSKLGGW